MIVATVSIGTFWQPWLPYGIASIYNLVDKIVITNSGYNFPFFNKDNVPLEELGEMIKEIDCNGKIEEIKGIEFSEWERKLDPAVSKQEPFRFTKANTGIRALGTSACVNIVVEKYKPEHILHFDSDQVFFNNLKNITEYKGKGCQFWLIQAYSVSPWHCTKEHVDASFSDGPHFFKTDDISSDYPVYFYGEGAFMNATQEEFDKTWVAHFRETYPYKKGERIDRNKLFNLTFRRHLLYYVDLNRLQQQNKTLEEIVAQAYNTVAKKVYEYPMDKLIPAPQSPPEVCEIGPEKYIKEGYPK